MLMLMLLLMLLLMLMLMLMFLLVGVAHKHPIPPGSHRGANIGRASGASRTNIRNPELTPGARFFRADGALCRPNSLAYSSSSRTRPRTRRVSV